MLAKVKLIEQLKIKSLFTIMAVLYLLVGFFSVLAVYQAQNSQHHTLEALALNNQQLESIASETALLNHSFARLVLVKTSGSRQLAITNSRWYLSFQEPIYLVFTSPLLLFFTLILFVSGLLMQKKLQRQLAIKLKPLQQLESWASLTLMQGLANELVVDDSSQEIEAITLAIRQLQQQIKDNAASDIAWDKSIRASALLDQETGIGNRAFFDNRLQALLKEEDAQGAVLLIQFKAIELVQNLYGYQQAISLLLTLIQITKQRLQDQPGYFLARHSLDELSVLLPNIFIEDAEKLAELLLKNLQTVVTPVGINQEEFVHIGMSYFVAEQVPYQIMSEADMALRAAQLQGPSQCFMFEAGELALVKAKGSLKWRTLLNAAINGNGFVIFFQPVIASDSAKVLHHEVLSKVKDKNGSLISARVFFPMAQKCGLMVEIDLLILVQVCRMLTAKKAQQSNCSINLSIDSLLSAGFTEKFLAILRSFPEVKDQLMIEISEYQLVNHLSKLQARLAALSTAGVKIIADKVGQYVVSAHYLNVYPIYAMKLHRSIVIDIDKKIENQVFIQSLRTLADAKNIPIYALGVEKQAEWRALLQLGVKGGQGHFFTEPLAEVAQAIALD
ncbi:EAL domain-containing protein [Colwellia sp. C1TZA3]|uniref:EAL domain-containing protein n=1 Tax=Colwellia sp. C1TZA3 TaxID=2508879 RepID=UPI0011B99EEE|nr:EAL domain-containing protein [Colwellia sp. C1TZA3]TWX72726.1 EAL domain-containing protein [Colwellia sp. C1TZA3]